MADLLCFAALLRAFANLEIVVLTHAGEKTLQPAQGHETGYVVELPSADFKRIVGKAAPILKVTCSMLRVVSAVASPIAKLAGMDLPFSRGIDLACLKDVQCGESSLGEIFEGTAVGDAIAKLEAVSTAASGRKAEAVAASKEGHDSDADAAHADPQAPQPAGELPLLEFVDASINQCEGIIEWAKAEAGVDHDEEAEVELGLDATSNSANAVASVQSVDAVKELILLACRQAKPPRETDVGKHSIAGLSKTVAPSGIRWLSAEGRAIELARDSEPEPELETQLEPEPETSSSELSESRSWTLPLIVEPNQLVESQQQVTLTLSSRASIREAQEQLKDALKVTGTIEIQLPSHHTVQSPHELQMLDDGPCAVQLCRPARRSRIWRRQLMQQVNDDCVCVDITEGSIIVSINGLPAWAATALASLALGGDSNSKFHLRMHEVLSQKFANVTGDLLQARLGGVEQAIAAAECAPYTAAEFVPEWYPEQEIVAVQELLRENAGRISLTQLQYHNVCCPRQLAEDRRRRQFQSTSPSHAAATPPAAATSASASAQEIGPWLGEVTRVRTPDSTLEERAPAIHQSLHNWLVQAQLGHLATPLQSILPTDIRLLGGLPRAEIATRCNDAGLDDSDTKTLLAAWDVLVSTTTDSRASTTVAEGVPPERTAQDQSEPEPEDELPTRSSDSPVNRSVSLQWLNDFVAQHRGTRFSFERREFMAPEDGGGNQSGIDITAETLDPHRSARRATETAGTGQPVTVRYVGIMFETMTTADVMEAIIRPVARVQHKSYAEAAIPLQSTDSPTYFVSHAWDSLFVDLVDGLGAYLEGAAQAETFPWLDIFAINQDDTGGQFSAMDELDDGRTLARVIELSRATLVVLDKDRVAPFARLWCLYEIGSTPPSKLQLLTHGFSEKDISRHIWNINAGDALCFSDEDRQMIHTKIVDQFGTMEKFTIELQLRLLLRPMSYAADLQALRDRAGPPETYRFDQVQQHVEAASDQVACVVGGPGEGKSTLAAMMLSTQSRGAWREPNTQEQGDGEVIVGRRVFVEGHGEGIVVSFIRARIGASSHVIKFDGTGDSNIKLARKGNRKTPWQVWQDYIGLETPSERDGGDLKFIHAHHFCKRSDTNRQDVGAIARSLGYQIAQHVDHTGSLMFGLSPEEAEKVQTDPVAAVQLLVVRQLEGLAAAGRRVVLLVDALDESQERGTNPVVRMLQKLGKADTKALSVVVTMRPQPEANLLILKHAFGSVNVRDFAPSELHQSADISAVLSSMDCLVGAPEWVAAIQAH